MSQLLDFYRLQAPDLEGRMLSDIWSWSDNELEQCHDFIQWMFPLDEPSSVNADAPLVTQEDQASFRSDFVLRNAYQRSLKRFLQFLGLGIAADGSVGRAINFDSKEAVWKYTNHNCLRITRLLKSLRLLGFESEAAAVWKCLKVMHEDGGFVSQNTFEYWIDAAEGLG
jgi:hypothetical protein